MLRGGTSTEINFQRPGGAYGVYFVGEKHQIVVYYLSHADHRGPYRAEPHLSSRPLSIVNTLWWPLRQLGKQFIHQDLGVFQKLKEGLETNPTLSLIGEPDEQSKWYLELKRQWELSASE